MASDEVGPALLEAIRAENLGVYRESPIRVREDASQEAEIAMNYRGRLVYELLQNADDAMYGDAGPHVPSRPRWCTDTMATLPLRAISRHSWSNTTSGTSTL